MNNGLTNGLNNDRPYINAENLFAKGEIFGLFRRGSAVDLARFRVTRHGLFKARLKRLAVIKVLQEIPDFANRGELLLIANAVHCNDRDIFQTTLQLLRVYSSYETRHGLVTLDESMATDLKPQYAAAASSALYSVLTAERLHGKGSVPIAVLILDGAQDRLYARFRDDLAEIADEEALDVLEGMEGAILERASEEGAIRLWAWFSETLSGAVRMGEPHSLATPEDWKLTLDRLFDEHVKQS